MDVDATKWFEALQDDAEDWERAEFFGSRSLDDAFSRRVSYGTGGVRALMGIGPNRLNRLTVSQISVGLANHLHKNGKARPSVVIAYDTRIHSKQFAHVASCVLAAHGVRAMLFPECQPTPVLSYAIRHTKADAGVVITASHNAMTYNGYKVYDEMGGQATNQWTESIQALMANVDPFAVATIDFEQGLRDGVIAWCPDSIVEAYTRSVLQQSTGIACNNISVSYTPLHGTGLSAVKAVLSAKSIVHSIVAQQSTPDGAFPTCPRPNPEREDAMQMVIADALQQASDIAVATDPDADRVGVAVSTGKGQMRLLTGDEVGLLLFDFLCQVVPLKKGLIAATTIVSSPLFDAIAQHYGIELRRTLTGFKYIGEQVNLLERQGRSEDFFFGAEESCGYLRGDYVRDKDGIVSLMLICEMAAWNKRKGRSLLDALNAIYKRYGYMISRQVSVESPNSDKGAQESFHIMSELRDKPFKDIAGISVRRTIDYKQGALMPGDHQQVLPQAEVLEFQLEHQCKVLIRPSGTEPKVKAYCFAMGTDSSVALTRLDAIANWVQQLFES